MSSPKFSDPVGRVRIVGLLDGISYLVLLGCSVLKRVADMPQGVKIFGPIHGALVVLLILVIFQAWGKKALTTKQSGLVFLASLLPFGPFIIDRKLAEEEGNSEHPAS